MYEDFEKDNVSKDNDVSSNAPQSSQNTNNRAKNFKVEISDEAFYGNDSDAPKSKRASKDKGVYFSNMQRRRAGSADKAALTDAQLKQRRKKWIIIVSAVVVCTIALSLYTLSCLNDILGVTKSSDNVTITIPKGADQKDILKLLKEEDLIEHPHFDSFVINTMQFMRGIGKSESKFEYIKDYVKNGSGIVYVDGMYDVNAKMGVETMMNRFKPNKKSNETKTLSFPEGWTVNQIAKRLDKAGVCSEKLFYQTLKSGDFTEFEFVKPAFENNKKYIPLEGYMYPDTYEFYLNETASSVIRRFLKNFDDKFPQKYRDRAEELGMTVDQVITLASIIEKEAADASQMKDISSVLHNRLKKPAEYPLLECNSTSDYVKNYITPNVTTEQSIAYRVAYNTYSSSCRGLPAGPICNPGAAAIEAALYPKKTDYYFFCHNYNGDGKIYLAKTADQQEANRRKALASKTN